MRRREQFTAPSASLRETISLQKTDESLQVVY
jgi:hypothetical protein